MFNLQSILSFFGGQKGFNDQFNQFGQQAMQNGIDPQKRVQQLLNSGQMSQQQFNFFRNIANMITGRRM